MTSTTTTMGPSGYRASHGTSDAKMFAVVREHLARNRPGVTLTDAQIRDAMGWAYTADSVVRKTEEWLAAQPPFPRISAADRIRQVVAILASLAPASPDAVENTDLDEVARRARCSRYTARWAVLYASTAATEEGVAVYLDDLGQIELRRGAKLTIRSDYLRPWGESPAEPGEDDAV
jgi:hypothetical protein